MNNLSVIESFIALFDTLLAAVWVAMGCVVAVHALPPDLVADSEPVTPSFDVAAPSLQPSQPVQANATLVVAAH